MTISPLFRVRGIGPISARLLAVVVMVAWATGPTPPAARADAPGEGQVPPTFRKDVARSSNEVSELPPEPPGRTIRPGDVRRRGSGRRTSPRSRRIGECPPGSRRPGSGRSSSTTSRSPRRSPSCGLGQGGRSPEGDPKHLPPPPGSPRAGSSGRRTWSSSRPRASAFPPPGRTPTAASCSPRTSRRTSTSPGRRLPPDEPQGRASHQRLPRHDRRRGSGEAKVGQATPRSRGRASRGTRS